MIDDSHLPCTVKKKPLDSTVSTHHTTVAGTQGEPLYTRIAQVLASALQSGSVPAGAILLEGHVADILGVTRTPVRQALRELEVQGHVSRFDGRGMVAGSTGTHPQRLALTADMMGINVMDEPVRKVLGWEALYLDVERDIVHLSVFGSYRINEVELARHFGVGRTVARDVLLRLEALGLVEKDERLRWTVISLDGKRISDLYELRLLLEPAALGSAAAWIPVGEIQSMFRRLHRAAKAYPVIKRAEMDGLEHDLHIKLLSHCTNPAILESLQRTRCILTLSKHVLGAQAPMPVEDPFMSEHTAVLQAVAEGNVPVAQSLLKRHLEESCDKVTKRAAYVREHMRVPHIVYAA